MVPTCVFINSDNKGKGDNEGNVRAAKGGRNAHRDDAMAKKNCKQAERYIIKAIQTSGRAAKAAGLSPGAVVTLKVDYCTHSHAQVLVGIVYAVKEEIGGILVCCVHGVITHSG